MSDFVTQAQLRLVEERLENHMALTNVRIDELKKTVEDTPDAVATAIEDKRRSDRRQFIRDAAGLLGGAAALVAAIVGVITLVAHHV